MSTHAHHKGEAGSGPRRGRSAKVQKVKKIKQRMMMAPSSKGLGARNAKGAARHQLDNRKIAERNKPGKPTSHRGPKKFEDHKAGKQLKEDLSHSSTHTPARRDSMSARNAAGARKKDHAADKARASEIKSHAPKPEAKKSHDGDAKSRLHHADAKRKSVLHAVAKLAMIVRSRRKKK